MTIKKKKKNKTKHHRTTKTINATNVHFTCLNGTLRDVSWRYTDKIVSWKDFKLIFSLTTLT